MASSQWRTRLEALWTRKIDEIILLSIACGDDTARGAADKETPAFAGSPGRLTSQLQQAYRDLTEIADAVDRLEAGHFGVCARCLRPMPPEWLDDAPQIGFCPDCSLHLVCLRLTVPDGVPAMRTPEPTMLPTPAAE